jgi:hypothetical protein
MFNLFNIEENKEENKKANRRFFYEVWGDLNAQNATLKIVMILMSIITIIALLTSYFTYKINRVPIVIRVSEVKDAKVLRNIPFNNRAGLGEMVYFSKSFIRQFTGFNSIMIKTQLSRALNKMSQSYAENTLKMIIRDKFIQNMKKANVSSRIKFKKIKLIKQTANHDELKLYVIRTVISNLNSKIENSSAFEDKLILKRIKRTVQYPFGLEVVYFNTLKLGGG